MPLEESIGVITQNVESHFDTGGDGDWAPWAVADAEGPVKPYQQTYRGFRLLDATGDMRGHATSPASYDVIGHTVQYRPEGIKDELFHSPGPYLRNIWERPFIGLNEVGIAEVEGIFAKWMLDVVNGVASKRGALRPGESLVVAPGASRVSIRGKGGRFVR
jgi:hypothetical protein